MWSRVLVHVYENLLLPFEVRCWFYWEEPLLKHTAPARYNNNTTVTFDIGQDRVCVCVSSTLHEAHTKFNVDSERCVG